MTAERPTERWMLRLETFSKALARLKEIVEMNHDRGLNEIERDALIKRYEFTYEMAWKLMMSYEKENGLEQIRGSKDIIREAYRFGLIDNAEAWFDMVELRNKTVHNYDEEMATDAVRNITENYYPLLEGLCEKANEAKEKTYS